MEKLTFIWRPWIKGLIDRFPDQYSTLVTKQQFYVAIRFVWERRLLERVDTVGKALPSCQYDSIARPCCKIAEKRANLDTITFHRNR